MQFKAFVFIGLIIFFCSTSVYSQVVCSEDELVKELREDLDDNGKLDCLRVALSPNEADETPEKRDKRRAAQWNGDCSFESEGTGEADWFSKLQQNYGLKKGLVDVNGEPVEKDFDDQADMCEIIRALVASGKFDKIGDDVKNISMDLVDYIDCAGNEGQTEVCAATGGSFANKDLWYILLEGAAITFGSKPKFVVAPTA